MLLAQKPPQSINFRHHRHPASLSGIVVPHPSSTPGMFAIAKPLRTPHRVLPRSQSPRCSPRNRMPHRVPQPPVERPIRNIVTVDSPRGRTKSEQQPTPEPTPSPPPASVDVSTTPSSREETSVPTVIAAQPSGRVATSRRSRNKSTPTAAAAHESSPESIKAPRASSPAKSLLPSAPIAVPDPRASTQPRRAQMARSDPNLSIHTGFAGPPKAGRKDKRRKNKANKRNDPLQANAEWDFPVHQESDDEPEGDSDEPSTPIRQTGKNDRSWFEAFNDGPKTAPLSGTENQFPFFTFPARNTAPRADFVPPVTPPRPAHRRAPSQPASLSRVTGASEGIFQFSEDEGDRTPSPDVQKKLALLFGTSGSPSSLFGTPSPLPRKSPKQRESADVGRALFASSSFQLAPEPVDLPKPSFLPRPNQA